MGDFSDCTKQWFVSSPLFLVSTLVIYLGFHLIYKPNVDHPLVERKWSAAKSAAIVVLNGLLAYLFIKKAVQLDYNWFCEPVTRPVVPTLLSSLSQNLPPEHCDKDDNNMLDLMFYFLITKIFECLDTVIYALRGFEPPIWVTVHHIIMFSLAWLGVVMFPEGTTCIFAMVNCTFHVVTYALMVVSYFLVYGSDDSYGAMSAEEIRDIIQSLISLTNGIQFLVVLCIGVTSVWMDCGYPYLPSLTLSGIVMIFLLQLLG